MYQNFAAVYDNLMCDVDYEKRTDYLISLFKKYGKMPTLLLDVACGTGGFSNCFCERGVEVIGADISEEMLSIAREKSYDKGNDILYLCQSAQELDLYGTVDGAICCLDSLNHITDYREFCKAIKRIALFLEEGSLFIFDLNTEYKHEQVLGDNVFVIENDEVYCVWANTFNKKDCSVDIALDFFVNENDTYYRMSEDFSERAYSENQVEAALKKAGLEIVKIFDDMTTKPLKYNSERAVYVTRRVK